MGGAERNARKKKQAQTQAARAVAAARGTGNDRTKILIGVAAVVVLAAVVVGGVLYSNSRSTRQVGNQPVPTSSVSAEYQAQREDGTVLAGKPDAKLTVDIYEDFLCPYCGLLEKSYGKQIEEQLAAGTFNVRYHLLPMLNNASDPPGYSLDSANAALCSADAGKFEDFHASLFATQPEEGERGYDNSQLIKLGRDLGISGDEFANCVNNGTHKQDINNAYEQARNDPRLQATRPDGRTGFRGTPTIVVGDQIINTQDPEWLNKIIKQAGQG
ncbi:DsbA family protein [Goodfellowiella coeruleoviolacea]|uniref:Protein-disulfide isomerase n=1 Tax=Goodfellowiella coeruleoviolacea TaxID=334858 RepID=A0AAE3GIE7_9PSEU|nr:DsbA family protein [Goodfellowiella coeruleoviolacea]MCP2167924.1 Protein-disulfide isomerase [Goodfellowiella coeruleoviolacea]